MPRRRIEQSPLRRYVRNGLIKGTLVPSKSRTLRVTTARPCSIAVAAIMKIRAGMAVGVGEPPPAPRDAQIDG